MKTWTWSVLVIASAFLFVACSAPADNQIDTQNAVAATVEAALAETAVYRTAVANEQATEVAALEAEMEAMATETGCSGDAAYTLLSENGEDNNVIEIGQRFTKTWEIQNTGACPWNEFFQAVRSEPVYEVDGPQAIAIDTVVNVGDIYTLTAEVIAPTEPGDYQIAWEMRNEDFEGFGDMLNLMISVPAPVETTAGLPQPLYYINPDDGQVWRIETDGETAAPVTAEPEGVFDFDVSVNNQIAYIASNNLFVVNADGSNKTLVAEGPPLEQAVLGSDYLDRPVWSPDGSRIAFAKDGVWIADPVTTELLLIQPSDPFPDLTQAEIPIPEDGAIEFYYPNKWSPDGTKLLLDVSYFPEAGNAAIKDIESLSLTDVSIDGTIACCTASWTADSASVVFASNAIVYATPGMWQVNAADGVGTAYFSSDFDGPIQFASSAQQLADGNIYFFYAQGDSPDFASVLSMHRIPVTGGEPEAVRDDAYDLRNVLWAADSSGALIATADNALVWLNVNGDAPIILPVVGQLPKWGAATE